MATRQTNSKASQAYGNNSNSGNSGGRDMGTNGSGDDKFISVLLLMSLLWFLVLPFELYLYIKVNQHINSCMKEKQ